MIFPTPFVPFWMFPSDDVDVINYMAAGIPGPPGPAGPAGPSSQSLNVVLVEDDYTAESGYIGVNSDKPVTITLPSAPPEGTLIIVKLEMGPPIGNRKVTVTGPDKIDDKLNCILTTPHESVTLLFRGQKWHIL